AVEIAAAGAELASAIVGFGEEADLAGRGRAIAGALAVAYREGEIGRLDGDGYIGLGRGLRHGLGRIGRRLDRGEIAVGGPAAEARVLDLAPIALAGDHLHHLAALENAHDVVIGARARAD